MSDPALLTGKIKKSDIENLRGMVSGLGVIGKIFNRVGNIIEKLMKTLKPVHASHNQPKARAHYVDSNCAL